MRRLLTLSAVLLGLAGCCHDTCDSCRDICSGCNHMNGGYSSCGNAMHLSPVPAGMPAPVVAPGKVEELKMQPREKTPAAPPAEVKPGEAQ